MRDMPEPTSIVALASGVGGLLFSAAAFYRARPRLRVRGEAFVIDFHEHPDPPPLIHENLGAFRLRTPQSRRHGWDRVDYAKASEVRIHVLNDGGKPATVVAVGWYDGNWRAMMVPTKHALLHPGETRVYETPVPSIARLDLARPAALDAAGRWSRGPALRHGPPLGAEMSGWGPYTRARSG